MLRWCYGQPTGKKGWYGQGVCGHGDVARRLCGGSEQPIAGGAATAQQFLNAGLIDEVQLHVVSMLLSDGLRLFEQVKPLQLERTRALESVGVTHLRYRVVG